MDILSRLRTRLSDGGNVPDDNILNDCIESAKNAILERRYPFHDWPVDDNGDAKVETRYLDLQFRIAMDLYNKIGAEGEMAHSENGVSRSYESSWISKALLDEIVPLTSPVR